MTERIETILQMAKEVTAAEEMLAAKRSALAEVLNGVAVNVEARPSMAEVLDAPKVPVPVSTRIRALFERAPGKRFNLGEIRATVPDASALALRKTLYRLTHEVKGFARDKRTRGVYYYKG